MHDPHTDSHLTLSYTQEGLDMIKDMNNPWKMGLFKLLKLPSLSYWGVRIIEVSQERTRVSIPYGWRTQNPFKSTYFAALAGAAELSTGIFCNLALAGRGSWSMLVSDFQISYSKKAISETTFTCTQGKEVLATVQKVMQTGESQILTMEAIGVGTDGTEYAKARVTWTFKKK